MPLIRPTGLSFDERARAADNYARMHLEPEELRRFFAAVEADAFWRGYFRLQFYFGCRVSEVAILLKEDVALKKHEILIRRLKKRTVGEAGAAGEGWVQYRYRDLPAKLIGHLAAVQARVQRENPWFFGSRQRAGGDPDGRAERRARIRITDGGWRAVSYTTAEKRFKALALAAGIPESLRHSHVIRHTRATLLFAAGATEREVQYLLSHSSPTITRKYIGWADRLKGQASLIAKLGEE